MLTLCLAGLVFFFFGGGEMSMVYWKVWLSPRSVPGGNGPLGVHQITGQGKSGIKINGKLLEAPYVRYPIDLDSDGGLTTKILLPESYVTAPGVGL